MYKAPWRSLAFAAFLGLSWVGYTIAGTSTIPITPGSGANMRETTDASGFNLPNSTIWDSVAGANGLKINSDNTLGATLSIGGAVDSATNGIYTNMLQGNAVLSATNGVFANILQGNAVLSVGNPIFVSPGTGANFSVTCTSGCASPAKRQVATTPTVQAAAYASGNAIGGLQTITAWSANNAGTFTGLSIASKGGSTQSLTFYVFATNPTGSTCTDKTAFVLAAADVSKMIAVAPVVLSPQLQGVGSTVTFASAQYNATVQGANTSIYICMVENGSVTPASTTDLVLTTATTD